jgi:cell fate regulator YaaT (PSP1 superfamily)
MTLSQPTYRPDETAAPRGDVVGVRLQKLGKLYHFRIGNNDNIAPGDHVLVETRRGRQIGQVMAYVTPDDIAKRRGLRPIERKASPRELVMQQVWESRNLEALISCRDQANRLGLVDIKFIKAQYNYDGSWIIIYYSSEQNRHSFDALGRELNRLLQSRVEFQLIGPRDVAKFQGGYGACGAPRCCSTFLTEFSPVSIRMAKEQGISLGPTEIAGMCGRLRCCLVYEYEQYVAARKELPRLKKRVGTPYGEGVVRDVRVMRDAVLVELADGELREVTRAELEPLDELEALKAKAEAGCSKHEGGGCDCGRKSADSPTPGDPDKPFDPDDLANLLDLDEE